MKRQRMRISKAIGHLAYRILTRQESQSLLVSYMRRGLGPPGKKDTPSGQNGVPLEDNKNNEQDLSLGPVRQQGQPIVPIPESVGPMFDFSLRLLDQAMRRHNRSLERFHEALNSGTFFEPPEERSQTFLPEKAFIAGAMAVLGVLRYPDVAKLNGFIRKAEDGD